MVRAAVLHEIGDDLRVQDVELQKPKHDEIGVRLVASGVCHSDLSAQAGALAVPTPAVLGHEGAGIVDEVGEGVADINIGDHVVISWIPQCGSCFYCARGQANLCERADVTLASGGLLDGSPRFHLEGAPLHQMAASGTFAERTVVPASGVVKIPNEFDLEIAALLGCGVLTGVGAALRTANIHSGDTVAVIGCGGVGLNVVQGARIAGAAQVIAVDVSDPKLELANKLGATDLVNASTSDAMSEVMSLTNERGADVVFEVLGKLPTIEQAIAMTRRGGETVLVGIPSMDVIVELPVFLGLVLAEKTLKGCWYGSSTARRDIPELLELYKDDKLILDDLITRTIGLDEVNDAFGALKSGDGARTIISFEAK